MKSKTIGWITGTIVLVMVLLASLATNEVLMLLSGSFLQSIGIHSPLLQNMIILVSAVIIIFLLNKKFDLKKLLT